MREGHTYMHVGDECTRLEKMLIQEIGRDLYRTVDRDSGFLGAGEEGLWLECLAQNLADDQVPISSEVRDLMRALFRIMEMDSAICDRLTIA